MTEFFKRCGIGIVVIVTSPLWVAYFALYAVYGVLLMILTPLKLLWCLITHKKFSIKSEYDERAEVILSSSSNPSQTPINNPSYQSQSEVPSSQNIPQYMFSSSPTTSFTSVDRNQPYQRNNNNNFPPYSNPFDNSKPNYPNQYPNQQNNYLQNNQYQSNQYQDNQYYPNQSNQYQDNQYQNNSYIDNQYQDNSYQDQYDPNNNTYPPYDNQNNNNGGNY